MHRSPAPPPPSPAVPAASPAPALARSPVAAADRPRLQLVPSDTEAADDGAEKALVRESASAKAQMIARATSGAIAYEDDGRVSVLFPPPGAVTAPPAAVLAREGAEAGEAGEAPAPTAVTAPSPVTAPAGAPAPAGTALDRDELYQDFMRRLRRDVLEQREQLGRLF
jgi:hypothetical protein